MNDESRPDETAPAQAPRTVLRSSDLEAWLVAAPLKGLMPPGLIAGFAEEVVVRLEALGPEAMLLRSPAEEFEEIEHQALDIAGRLVSLVAYDTSNAMIELVLRDLASALRNAAHLLFAARNLRIESERA